MPLKEPPQCLAAKVTVSKHIPRPEYPRPQFVRDDWLCLNGEWQFEIDPGDSGLERGLLRARAQGRDHRPLLPGVELSGIGNTDFMHGRLVPA